MKKDNISYIGSWTVTCGHGLGTEEASRPLYKAIGSPTTYCEIVPEITLHKETNEHSSDAFSFNDKLAEILDVTPRLRDSVSERLQNGENIVVLGGDHSIALGSVAGTLTYDSNVAVIWFDAHGDVNTETTSPSGNIHGMPVAALLGLCKTAINDVPSTHLKTQNIFWIGVRDLDEGEKQIAREYNLTMFSAEDVRRLGMKAVMKQIAERLQKQNIRTLHLSFDIDGMDPAIVKATGTKVPNGLTQDDFNIFLNCLASFQNKDSVPIKMRVLDFVEYNPTMDTDGTTLLWCKNALESLLNIMG